MIQSCVPPFADQRERTAAGRLYNANVIRHAFDVRQGGDGQPRFASFLLFAEFFTVVLSPSPHIFAPLFSVHSEFTPAFIVSQRPGRFLLPSVNRRHDIFKRKKIFSAKK
jgi:hypothetical protein